MANKKKYVVTLLYRERGSVGTSDVVGVFTTMEKAMKAVENLFHCTCDRLGIEELNTLSYQEEDNFHIEIDNGIRADGTITEVEENNEYEPSDFFTLTEKDVKTRQVQVHSLYELDDEIKKAIDNGEGPVELKIYLNYGAYVRYTITFADETDELCNYKYEIHSLNDESEVIVSRAEFFDADGKTNIGKAMMLGALYMVLD